MNFRKEITQRKQALKEVKRQAAFELIHGRPRRFRKFAAEAAALADEIHALVMLTEEDGRDTFAIGFQLDGDYPCPTDDDAPPYDDEEEY